jgi:hypothetical protein
MRSTEEVASAAEVGMGSSVGWWAVGAMRSPWTCAEMWSEMRSRRWFSTPILLENEIRRG